MDCARIVVGNWKMNKLPKEGTVFISVNDNDKVKAIALARDMEELGFGIISTHGTSQLLNDNGIMTKKVYKVGEGRPNIVDYIKNDDVDLIINTPFGGKSREDEYEIGRSAIRYKIPAFTTISGAKSVIRAIRSLKGNNFEYMSLQEIFEK